MLAVFQFIKIGTRWDALVLCCGHQSLENRFAHSSFDVHHNEVVETPIRSLSQFETSPWVSNWSLRDPMNIIIQVGPIQLRNMI